MGQATQPQYDWSFHKVQSGHPFEGLDTHEFKCGTDYITLSMSHSSNYLAPPGKLAIKEIPPRYPSCPFAEASVMLGQVKAMQD